MITVEQIIDDILRREGWPKQRTAAKHPADKGGWTKWGITAAAWGSYRVLGREATPAELDAITIDQARAFYHRRHVAPYDAAPSPLRELLVDWSVTSWHDDPVKALQTALASRGFYAGRVDGVLGPKTRAAIVAGLQSDWQGIYRDVFKARMVQVIDEAIDDPLVQAFLKRTPNVDLHNLRGWRNRVLEFTP